MQRYIILCLVALAGELIFARLNNPDYVFLGDKNSRKKT